DVYKRQGEDYQKATRWEIPLIADLLFFINPYDRIQFYGLVGIGASIGQQGNYSRRGRFLPERGLVYIGGEVGLGVEWRWTRHFAVHFDVRAFLREQVGSSGPEFAEFDGRALRTTNTSAGVYGNLGLTLYFAGL
ncbi:MAG: hypothetical protein N2515_06160, partial [Deltaproteobacteria bacterium]|nr:hypothetical protein [Deltaproteobacteria bacterium]